MIESAQTIPLQRKDGLEMAKKLETFRLWKAMKPSALRQLALAVFLLFGVIGPLSTLMESHIRVVPWRFVVIQTLASGGMGASIIYFARKGWWMVVLSVIVWTSLSVLNSGAISFIFDERGMRVELGGISARASGPAAPAKMTIGEQDLSAIYTQRSVLGALAIVLLASGYIMFIRVISKELEQRARLETEVTIAREIQQSLLPLTTYETAFGEASGVTVPATEVGGDFFDIMELPGPELAVAIADVSGHGVGAGILAAMTKSALRSQIQNDRRPLQVLQNLNHTMFELSTEKVFVTFAYLLVIPSGGIVRYATAGHPPILVRTAGDSEVSQLRTVNVGLGMKDSFTFTDGEFQVTQGTSVLLYTDGILEAANEQGEQFGPERLTQAFLSAKGSSRQVCEAVLSAVNSFAEGSEPTDDISLVCVHLGK